jgi:hypothetical protein
MKNKIGFILFCVLLFFAVGPNFSHAAKKRGPIVIGIGGGYSFFLDSGLRSYEVYYPKLIYFSEQLDLENNINFYVQYFPWRGFGFQMEFDHQRAGYKSDLKWYGYADSAGKIIEIDYIEEPYRENWSFSSIAVSILYALTLSQNEKVRPYISAGVGYYFSSGDEERFYNRSRLGPGKNGNLIKLGVGIKYRLTPKIGINLKGSGGTIWRREYGWGEVAYLGSEQFDPEIYEVTGQIIRAERYLVNSFSYLGITLSLEYTL